VVEGGFAPGDPVTHWNLKDRLAALGSNRIGLDLCWLRLAPRSCWPRLPFEFETNFVNDLGVAQYLWQGPSVLEPCLFLDLSLTSKAGITSRVELNIPPHFKRFALTNI
jgi:hypothetical protein